MFALVLTGPLGAGKTDVLAALSDALVAEDVRHDTIEVEALTSAHPALGDEQWTATVGADCGLYQQFGYQLQLLTVTVEAQADLDAVLDAVGADEHNVVRLDADPATLRQRIIEREPDGWPGLDDLLTASARLRPVITSLSGVALALSTEGEQPPAVAERISDAVPRRAATRAALSRHRPAARGGRLSGARAEAAGGPAGGDVRAHRVAAPRAPAQQS